PDGRCSTPATPSEQRSCSPASTRQRAVSSSAEEHMATRQLVQGLRRTPRYRVLVVSDRATRLFEAVRDELTEIHDHGFPLGADIGPPDRAARARGVATP